MGLSIDHQLSTDLQVLSWKPAFNLHENFKMQVLVKYCGI